MPLPLQIDTPVSAPKRQEKAILFIALAAHACTHVFLLVIMPILGRRLGMTDMQTGTIMGLSACLLILSGPFWGVCSDRIGRRPVLLIGLSAAAAFPLVLAILLGAQQNLNLTPNIIFAILLCARMTQVTLSGGIIPTTQAWFADHTPPHARASSMAFMGVSYGCGSICGAALVWVFGGQNLITTIYLLSAAIVFGTISLYAILPAKTKQAATSQQKSATPPLAKYIKIKETLLQLWPFLLITALATVAYSILTQVLPLRLVDEFGMTPQEATQTSGKIMMFAMCGMVLGQSFVTRKISWQPIRLLQFGSLGAIAATGCAAMAQSPTMLTFAIASLGAAFGLMGPGNMALLSLASSRNTQAKAAGTNEIAKGVGMVCGPILGAYLHHATSNMPFLCSATLMAVVACVALYANKHSEQQNAVTDDIT